MKCTNYVQPDSRDVILSEMKRKAHSHHRGTIFTSINEILAELRSRRKSILGTSVSLCSLVFQDGKLDPELVEILEDHLASSANIIWNNQDTRADQFTHLFFRLSIIAITEADLRDECLDDLIHLGTLLTHDKSLFENVMRSLLAREHLPLLYSLTEDFPDSFYSGAFEHAVFSSIAVFSGALNIRLEEA